MATDWEKFATSICDASSDPEFTGPDVVDGVDVTKTPSPETPGL